LLVPTSTMPGWLQAFVKVNPVRRGARAVVGGPAAGVVERSPLWALGIFLVFAPLAVAMYRRRT
jgi:oleandomycin transport system permease protein